MGAPRGIIKKMTFRFSLVMKNIHNNWVNFHFVVMLLVLNTKENANIGKKVIK